MPKFPKKEVEILALANQMIAGFMAHIADFPNVIWPLLYTSRLFYKIAKVFQTAAEAELRISTEAKNTSLRQLKSVMKSCLKKSEVDTTDNPEKLTLIGWRQRTASQPVELPPQPNDLKAIIQGQGTLQLLWDRPIGNSGGAVRNYIIQRRRQLVSGEFGEWTIAGTSLTNQITLTSQLRSIQLEYRVKAANTGGKSMPSNTMAIVL